MFKIIELEIDPNLTGETGVFEVAWVESPAIEQEMMVFKKMNFYKATDEIAAKACRAIKENEERGNIAATMVGKVRGRQLCNQSEISLETVKRMFSYLSRAKTYDSGNWDDKGTISYNLWGGDPALEWSKRIIEREEEKFQDEGLEDACWEGYIAVGMKPADDGSGRMVPNCVPEESFQKFVYPSSEENESDFISRCISDSKMNDEFPDEKQRAAVCYSYWRRRNEFALQKVSFDWDGVLTTSKGKDLFEQELRNGNEVHIISARSSMSKEMMDFLNKYKLSQYRIHLTGSNPRKIAKVKELGIIRHYDDNIMVRSELGPIAINFDYDISALPDYVSYPESGDTNSMLVEPILLDEEDDLDIFGYKAKNFEICPASMILFEHYISMNPDEDTIGMIRSLALIADMIFGLEIESIAQGYSTTDILEEAIVLANDFKDLAHEIDERLMMEHDVRFIDNHIEVIRNIVDDTQEMNPENWNDEEKMAQQYFSGIWNTQREKFEAITNPILRGFTEQEILAMNHKNPTTYYRYEQKVFDTKTAETRDFCMSLEGRYFRLTQIYALENYNRDFGHNRQPYSKLIYKGGPNCVHAYRKFTFLRKNAVDEGWAPGKAGMAPMEMPLQGYYDETTRAKSKRAYAIKKSQGFSQTFMTEEQYECVFGCHCDIGFSKSKEQLFASIEEKRMIYTPLMIPNILIPRLDEVSGEKYYVKFTPETINKIAKKFAIEGRNRKTNYEHSEKKFEDIVMVESWIVEGPNDKAYQLGFTQEQIPIGTWMGGYYVLPSDEGDDVWENYVKNGKVKGASVEGSFILNFSSQESDEYLLRKIINILKTINE